MSYLFPVVAAIILLGTYSLNYNLFDLWVVIGMAVVGYILKRLDYPTLPLLLGVILGPILEASLRRALIISGGDYTVFLSSTIALAIMALTGALLAAQIVNSLLRMRMAKGHPS